MPMVYVLGFELKAVVTGFKDRLVKTINIYKIISTDFFYFLGSYIFSMHKILCRMPPRI
jgi:hypothetical protein